MADLAIERHDTIQDFLRQTTEEHTAFGETRTPPWVIPRFFYKFKETITMSKPLSLSQRSIHPPTSPSNKPHPADKPGDHEDDYVLSCTLSDRVSFT